ncbi:MAG TPA: hypothetical protein VF532_01280, partial [Candidatus Angelobacter sp.]
MPSLLRALTLSFVFTGILQAQTGDRAAAIERALDFIRHTASNPAAFAEHGDDFMLCFYTISRTAQDPKLRASAAKMARDAALKWRAANPHVPADADADTVGDLVAAAYIADALGARDRAFKAELRTAARRFAAEDYLGFNAAREPPPPESRQRYALWNDALVRTYFGDAYGIRLGASYADVVQWLPQMRPYHAADSSEEFAMFYAVTHLVYTLNAYNTRRINPALLPDEVAFVKRMLVKSMGANDRDPEMVGEALDCLKAFGLENDPLVRQGGEFLLARQLADGAWVSEKDTSLY